MLVFRPFNTKSPAENAGNSKYSPGHAHRKRKPSVSDLDLFLLGAIVFCAAVVGFARKETSRPLAAAPSADQVDTAIIEREEPLIWDVLLRYGKDHGGRIPTFDSRRLPNWWMSYSRHPIFDYRYVLKSRYANWHLDRIVDWDSATFLRPVVTSGPNGSVKPVLRFGPHNPA